MYIDTHSEISMKNSIYEYLGITPKELSQLFKTASKASSREFYFDDNIFNKKLNEFICSHLPNKQIDQIMFFHLSRRLNSTQNNLVGNNLFDLLSTNNELSDFLKNYNVKFLPHNGHLELYYKGKLKSLENTFDTNVCYLKRRLGYIKGREDFCFNGFAFKDLLYKNNYARELFDVPEFIGALATFLNCNDIGTNYYLNSKYYCFEYCVPIDKVIFDCNCKMSTDYKKIYIINRVLYRLYEHSTTSIRNMYDNDNPVLRLSDSDTMQQEYFITKEEITSDMLL